jgi:hypothetical protein
MAMAGKAPQLRNSGDTEGLFELIQDYHSYLNKPLSDVPIDHFQYNDEWHQLQSLDQLALRPDPAPSWNVSEIIRTLWHDGIMNLFQVKSPDHVEPKMLQCLEFATDIINTSTQTSPFSVQYYTSKEPPGPNSPTIPIQIQIDGGTNRSITSWQDLLHCFKQTTAYPIYGPNMDDVALQCIGCSYLPWMAENGDTYALICLNLYSATSKDCRQELFVVLNKTQHKTF